jgi:hypothetical protein
MDLRICGSFKPVENNWVRKSQTSKYAIRGFAIYRTYLRGTTLFSLSLDSLHPATHYHDMGNTGKASQKEKYQETGGGGGGGPRPTGIVFVLYKGGLQEWGQF